MNVLMYHGKLYYPLLCPAGAAAALDEARVRTSKGKDVPVFARGGVPCQEMRAGLEHLLSQQRHEATIADIFTLSRREVMELPKTGTKVRFLPRSGPEAGVRLGDIRFFLFETGVALLELSVEMEGLPLEDVMNATYYLAEVKDSSNRFQYELFDYDRETGRKTARTVTLSMKDYLVKCAGFLPGCRPFEDRELRSAIAKPLLFSYYLLEDGTLSPALLSNLALNYKLSYRGLPDRRHVLPLFDNSCWCASYNGAANVSWQTGEAGTDSFFRATYIHKWETEYLFLFVNAVHQKYAVLKYLADIGELSCAKYDYDRMRELLDRGELLRERSQLLKLRCFFRQPSNVEHVDRLHDFIQNRLDIPKYLRGMNEGLDSLVSICGGYVSRISEIEDLEKKKDSMRKEVLLALAAAAVSCLAFFRSFYATLSSLFAGDTAAIGLDSAVVALTFLTTIATAACNIVSQCGNIAEVKQKIQKRKAAVGKLSGSEKAPASGS